MEFGSKAARWNIFDTFYCGVHCFNDDIWTCPCF